MPKFISVDGVWKPITKSTKKLLRGMGLKTIGQNVKNDSNLAVDTQVEDEERIEESGSDEQKKTLANIKKRRGGKGKRIKTKSA